MVSIVRRHHPNVNTKASAPASRNSILNCRCPGPPRPPDGGVESEIDQHLVTGDPELAARCDPIDRNYEHEVEEILEP
jgi:hypothetical protein